MAQHWGVKCKTCEMVEDAIHLPLGEKQVEWKSPGWKAKLICPECGRQHEYESDDLELVETPG
jgi:hypothetical protein